METWRGNIGNRMNATGLERRKRRSKVSLVVVEEIPIAAMVMVMRMAALVALEETQLTERFLMKHGSIKSVCC